MTIYWDDHTKKPLSMALNKVLITDHIEKLENEFVVLLDARDIEKITSLYALIRRDFTLIPRMASVFENYVKKTGESEISSLLAMHKHNIMKNENANPKN